MSIASISSRIRRAHRNSTGFTLSFDDLRALGGAGILHRLALIEADEICREAGVEPPKWTFETGGGQLEGPTEAGLEEKPEEETLPSGRGAYSVAQLAKRWACSEGLVRKLIRQGKLARMPTSQLIRISVAEVQRYEATPGT